MMTSTYSAMTVLDEDKSKLMTKLEKLQPRICSQKQMTCTLILGCSQSGKSTLVQHLVRKTRGVRMAVLVAGSRGVDLTTVCSGTLHVNMATGHCTHCTTYASLKMAVRDICSGKRQYDHGIIEVSDAVAPKPILALLEEQSVKISRIITVVDAAASDITLSCRGRQQLHLAHLILLNKCASLPFSVVKQLEKKIRMEICGVPIWWCNFCQVPACQLMNATEMTSKGNTSRYVVQTDVETTEEQSPLKNKMAEVSASDAVKFNDSVHSVVTSKRARPHIFSVPDAKRRKADKEEALWGRVCCECPEGGLVNALLNVGKLRGNVVRVRSCKGRESKELFKAKVTSNKRVFHLHLHERSAKAEERAMKGFNTLSRGSDMRTKAAKHRRKDVPAMLDPPKRVSRLPSRSDMENVKQGCPVVCGLPEVVRDDGGEDTAGPSPDATGECRASVPSKCSFFNEVSRVHSSGRSWSNDEHRSYLNDIEEKFVDRLYRQEYCAFDVCGQSPPLSPAVPPDYQYDYSPYVTLPMMDSQPLYPPFVSQAYTLLVDDPNDCGECSGPMDLQDTAKFIARGGRTVHMEDTMRVDSDAGRANVEPAEDPAAFGSQPWEAFPYCSQPPFDNYQKKPWEVLAPAFDPAMRWGSLGAQQCVQPSQRDIVGQMRMGAKLEVGVICEPEPAANRVSHTAVREQLRLYRDVPLRGQLRFYPEQPMPAGQQAKRDLMDGWISHKSEKLKLELMEEEQRLEKQFQMQERHMQLEEEVDSPLTPLASTSSQERWALPGEADCSVGKAPDCIGNQCRNPTTT